jgi:hypothetical protein
VSVGGKVVVEHPGLIASVLDAQLLLVELDLVDGGKGDGKVALVDVAVHGYLEAGHLDILRHRVQSGPGVLAHVRLEAFRHPRLVEGADDSVHENADNGQDRCRDGNFDKSEAASSGRPLFRPAPCKCQHGTLLHWGLPVVIVVMETR